MSKIKVSDLASFDMAEELRDEADIAEYLSQVLEDGDVDELVRAVGHIAKARGMAQIAESAGLGRESLYKALRSGSKPQFSTIMKVTQALGLKMQLVPDSQKQSKAIA